MLGINRKELLSIYEHAEREYADECCGVLLGSKHEKKVQEIYCARNTDVRDRRKIHFLINPLELYRVEREAAQRGLEIVGFYHSHADYPAELSAEDEQSMIPELLYIVISVINGECVDVKGYSKAGLKDKAIEIKIHTDC